MSTVPNYPIILATSELQAFYDRLASKFIGTPTYDDPVIIGDTGKIANLVTVGGHTYWLGPIYPLPFQYIAAPAASYSATTNLMAYQLDETNPLMLWQWYLRTQAAGVEAGKYFTITLATLSAAGSPTTLKAVQASGAADIAGDEVSRILTTFSSQVTTASDTRLSITLTKTSTPDPTTLFSTVKARDVYATVA